MRRNILRGLPLCFLALGGPPVAAQEIVDRSTLRVCADPHNLPFSDEKKEGFEKEEKDLNITCAAITRGDTMQK